MSVGRASEKSTHSYFLWDFLLFPFIFCDTVQLLDFEARSGEQVPLLLKMKRSHLALSKAVESGDTDLGECPAPVMLLK